MDPQELLTKIGLAEPERKGMSFSLFLLSCILLLSVAPLHGQQVAKTSPAGTKMWVYTPPSYATSTTTHPLLIFLHGGGELGDDLTKLTTQTSNLYPPKLISLNRWDTSLPFIVVSPQLKRNPNVLPNEHTWPTSYVNEVVEYIRKNYRVDSYRIYISGVSLGAAGAWDYTAAYASKIAALVPISGKADPAKACLVKNVPIWAFHGQMDGLVPPKFSTDMVSAIKRCSPLGIYTPRLNLLHARTHEGWSELYAGTLGINIYQWLLKFGKNVTTNKTPYVNANTDNKILLRTTSYHIAGDYFDWDGTISAIRWTQTAGTALTLAGTTTAFLKLSGLKVGTYEFQLAVTDNSGAVSSDRVKLTVVSPTAPPAVNSMVLMNGKTNADIGTITENMVINKTTLGTTEFNVRANVSTGVYSVKFHVNSDQQTKIVNSPGPYLIKKQTSGAEWTLENGTYVICATPYPQTGGRGTPGITLCYRVSVTTTTTASTTTSISQIVQPVTIKAIDDILVSNVSENNQWVFNGEDIQGATGPIYKPGMPGEYYVRIVDRPNFDLSNSVKVEMDQALMSNPLLEVFPNPANDYLQIRGEAVPQGAMYKIIRSGGVVVQEGSIDQDQRINFMEHLSKGNYILIVKTKQGNRSVKFLIQ